MKFGRWWSGKSRKRHNDADRRAAETGCGGGFDASLTEPLIDYARDYARTHAVDHFLFGHMHFARDYREGRCTRCIWAAGRRTPPTPCWTTEDV